METIILNPFAYTPYGRFGKLHLPGMKGLYTVEQPWKDVDKNGKKYPAGVPFHSCIPEGEYELRPVEREERGSTWVIVNEALGVYEFRYDRNTRYGCLIHSGNTYTNVAGCIAPGMLFGCACWLDEPIPAVISSAEAMRVINRTLDRKKVYKLIIEFRRA